MKIPILNKKITIILTIGLLIILSFLKLCFSNLTTVKMVMGGQIYQKYSDNEKTSQTNNEIDNEKYFRPSNLPIINDRNFNSDFFNDFSGKEYSKITLPDYLLKAPNDAIINYFSILREAANPKKGSKNGCGTLGRAEIPYPIAYNFLSPSYQKKLNYNEYLKSFENILHINLIKLKEIPIDEEYPNNIRYFVEIETIEGAEKNISYFAYYYGYIYISKNENQFKINNLVLHGEDYLCAPYHGWDYIAEAIIDIKYGNWYGLVNETYATQQDNFAKNIYFKGTDGNDYRIEFLQLTNGVDIEIAQYIKNKNNKWEPIKIDSSKYLKED